MNVIIGYSEINTLISKKTNHPIRLSYESESKFKITYTHTINIPFFGPKKKEFSIPLSIYHASWRMIVLNNESEGFLKGVIDVLIDMLSGVILSIFAVGRVYISSPIKYEGGKIYIKLDELISYSSLEKYLILNSLSIRSDGIMADIDFNSSNILL